MTWIILFTALLLLRFYSEALSGDYVGCYQHSSVSASNDDQLNYVVESSSAAESPSICIERCKILFYKYAGILNSQHCYCGSSYGNPSNDSCSIPCKGSSAQLCGGVQSISVYETGVLVSGAPRSLSILSKNENTLKLKWEPPQVTNGPIQEYQIIATPVSSYSLNSVTLPMEWTFSNTTSYADLQGLQPGTKYNVTIRTKTMDGYGIATSGIFNTEIGVPETPDPPLIIKSVNNQATLRLKPVLPTLGPVTKYQIIVVNEDVASLGVHKDTPLKGWAEAKAQNLPYYITAELTPEQFKQEFVVGDGSIYQGFMNPPLPDDREVLFILSVISTYEGVSKVAFSESSKPVGVEIPVDEVSPITPVQNADTRNTPVVEEDANINGNNIVHLLEEAEQTIRPPFRKDKPLISGRSPTRKPRPLYGGEPPALVIGLSAAIGVLGFLLLVSILVYFYLRHKVHHSDLTKRGRSRRPSDRQGLTMYGGSTIELDNGYVHSSYVMGIEETPVDHYESLKQRLWNIPEEQVKKTTEILGTGHYGTVHKGFVLRGETNVEAALHCIEDNKLTTGDRQSMLKDLGVLVKVGQHANIAGFIGICEQQDVVLVAMEHYGITLKEFLLNSRALNNYPSYAEKEQRFSTLHEAQAIDMALGVAKGMTYLQSLSVPHKLLASRTVLVCDGTVAKVFGFGMDFYQQSDQHYDFKRWTAPEALSIPQHAPKCEVWSFGVILWEIVTLGATPYANVRTKDLVHRVQRGLRLQQPSNVGLSLYQIMISCWQVDLDERPSFQEITDILQQAFNQALDYLSFNLFPDFSYEKYDPSVELNR